jgi:dTDP-4-dehydrorhamnose 3,5-epimerase
MSLKLTAQRLAIPDVMLITPVKFGDARGFFSETYNAAALRALGLEATFVQDNHSLSTQKGVVRGLHFQRLPHAQGKLVRVVRGRIFDVAVDIRAGSSTFGKHVSVELSADNWQQMWVPEGFAHGFCTLEDNTEVIYKVTDYYAPECDAGIQWNDPELGIEWPISAREAVLSEKDSRLPNFLELPEYFICGV